MGRALYALWVVAMLVLMAIPASASRALSSEETGMLRAGCMGNCKSFDCGYFSHCRQHEPGDDCLGSSECNQVPGVPMCVAPDPAGSSDCSRGDRGACGYCTKCVGVMYPGEPGYPPQNYCADSGEGGWYQVHFTHCP
jgi:hypothetical protein